jgi:hypothetical protein
MLEFFDGDTGAFSLRPEDLMGTCGVTVIVVAASRTRE